jgi:phenylacetate-CoA ligase
MWATSELIHQAVEPSRLRDLLPRWLEEVPLYRRRNGGVHLEQGAAFDAEAFRRLPFITKEDIGRGFPRNFLPAGVDLDTLLDLDLVEVEQTSGTSGHRVPLLLGRHWWAAQEERALRLNPLVAQVLDEFPAARRVTINSPVCSGDLCYKGVPSRAEREVGGTLFTSLSRHPFLWSDTDLARMAAEARAWQPQFLDVDPVYGALFARYCERRGLRLPSLLFILCSYEFVSVVHRRSLQRAFGVPVFDLYGSTETGHLLMEDEHGQMLPSPGTAYLEVPEEDAQGVGELVVTTLSNDYMPLIRYRIGDLVERAGSPDRPSYRVHGRTDDAFTGPEGRRVTTRQVDECFDGLEGILHYQVVQSGPADWCLRFVPEDRPPKPAALKELEQRLSGLLGLANGLTVHPSDALLAEKSGKFRLGYPTPPPKD